MVFLDCLYQEKIMSQVCLIWASPYEGGKQSYLLPATEFTSTIATLFKGDYFMNEEAVHAILDIWEKAGYQEDYLGLNVYDNVKLVCWFPAAPCACRKKGICTCGKTHTANILCKLSVCHEGKECKFCIHVPPAILRPVLSTYPALPNKLPLKQALQTLAQSVERNTALVNIICNIVKAGSKCLVLVRFKAHGLDLAERLKDYKCSYVGKEHHHPGTQADILIMTKTTFNKSEEKTPQDIVLTYPMSQPPVVLRGKIIHYIRDPQPANIHDRWHDCDILLTR